MSTVRCLCLLLWCAVYVQAPSTTAPQTTGKDQLVVRTHALLSDVASGFRLTASILASLKRRVDYESGRLSGIIGDVRRMEEAQTRVGDSMKQTLKTLHALNASLAMLEPSKEPCPAGWTRRGHRCYQFTRCATPCSANENRIACKSKGATLASVRSAEENAFVMSLIRDNVTTASVMLGGRDEVKEGRWLWPDGSPFQYTNWNPGQPDNCCGGKPGQHCMLIWPQLNNKWDDHVCDSQYTKDSTGYVCERSTLM